MDKGLIFDIQHFAVHDGPGIRTLVFLKGCPMKCSWCCNPESQSFSEQLHYNSTKCIACFSCVEVCPFHSAKKSGEKVTFDFNLCISCEQKPCVQVCGGDALRICGKVYTANEVVDIIKKDIDFYRNSGGGVTFTGGEPLSQPEFLLAMLRCCKKHNIHTAIETCGYSDPAVLKKIIPFTDLFLYDLKNMDEKFHEQFTGKPNEIILNNLALIVSSGIPVIIRVPLIPGITDTSANLGQIAAIANKLGIKAVNLEPYNPLGEEKYTEFGMPGKPEFNTFYTEVELIKVIAFFKEKGMLCELA